MWYLRDFHVARNPETQSPCCFVFVLQGLYPESSGIVGNSMYDPSLNESFRIGSSTSYNPHWWGGEPVRFILLVGTKRIIIL